MSLTENNDNIRDIEIAGIKKQKFRINGDNSKILELNTSDLNILSRLEETVPKLEAEMTKLSQIDADSDDLSGTLREADKQMREYIDYIFDSNVSDVCLPHGNMYDPVGGTFKWEHIITSLSGLYETDLKGEFMKLKKNVQKHTSKYTGTSGRKSSRKR